MLTCPLLLFHTSPPTKIKSKNSKSKKRRRETTQSITSLARFISKEMAALTSYEMAASILLCAEDSSSVLGFGGEEEEEEEDVVAGKRARCAGPPPPPCVDVAGVDFAVPSEECVARLVETEADHMPREDYAERLRAGGGDGDLDLRVRMDAIDWIWKVGVFFIDASHI